MQAERGKALERGGLRLSIAWNDRVAMTIVICKRHEDVEPRRWQRRQRIDGHIAGHAPRL
jgi:hypothetical protein